MFRSVSWSSYVYEIPGKTASRLVNAIVVELVSVRNRIGG